MLNSMNAPRSTLNRPAAARPAAPPAAAPQAGLTSAREYLRVSLDKNDGASVDEQHGDNERAAEVNRFALGAAYRDPNRSASRYAKKAREAYDALIADLEHDRFGATVLMLWESSRGSRRVGEWVLLIDLAEERGVKIHVTTHGRTYDPKNPRDRRSLLEDAVDSEYESSKISTRTARSAASRAAQGKPVGHTPFGYVRIYDPLTKKLVEQKPLPAEAKIVRELFQRLKKGHSLRSVAKDFEARGIRSRSGKVFSAQHLRSLALTHAYVGWRVHMPGRSGSRKIDATATIVEGQWRPLVDKRTFLAVQRILTAPERVTTRPGRGVHLLSMIARCAVCEGPLAATNRSGEPQYQCHRKGCCRIGKAELDVFAEDAILGFLGRDDHRDKMLAAEDNNVELTAVRTELAELRAHLDETYAAAAKGPKRGGISAGALARVEPKILADIQALERRDRELSTPTALSDLVDYDSDLRKWWRAADMGVRRRVARWLLVPSELGELRVTRTPTPGHRAPVDRRVDWLIT